MPNGKPSPTYYVKYQLSGNTYYKSTGCRIRNDAEKWATTLLDKLKQQTSAKGLVENFRDVLAGRRVVLLVNFLDIQRLISVISPCSICMEILKIFHVAPCLD